MNDVLAALRDALDRKDWLAVAAEARRIDLLATSAIVAAASQSRAPEPTAPERLNATAAAAVLGISKTQLRRYAAAGDLAYERYGRRLVFTRTALEDFAASRSENGS